MPKLFQRHHMIYSDARYMYVCIIGYGTCNGEWLFASCHFSVVNSIRQYIYSAGFLCARYCHMTISYDCIVFLAIISDDQV